MRPARRRAGGAWRYYTPNRAEGSPFTPLNAIEAGLPIAGRRACSLSSSYGPATVRPALRSLGRKARPLAFAGLPRRRPLADAPRPCGVQPAARVADRGRIWRRLLRDLPHLPVPARVAGARRGLVAVAVSRPAACVRGERASRVHRDRGALPGERKNRQRTPGRARGARLPAGEARRAAAAGTRRPRDVGGDRRRGG